VLRARRFGIFLLLLTVAGACRDKRVQAAESALKTQLELLRARIDPYRDDQGRYPPTLDALVEAGYIRQIPYDPFTRRNDTWIATKGPAMNDCATGIVHLHSGAAGKAMDDTNYSDW
jgi:general secretion pathway protein G